ncbi:1-phosphofructokinase [Lachnospira multipara]|uniref:1-phosphofructokinase n=1 Tax=Lachnospira multipara TaxID=28051 RepID=UPI000480FD3A|nr:1-phosphofructokinase [Lachnospira multipara]
MVYTITFNPALDYVMHMDSPLDIGETNRSQSEELYYGGKGINVSVVLNELGVSNVSLGFIAGFTGDAIDAGVAKMGVITDFIKLPKGISRINVKLKASKETEINAQGPDIDEASIDALFEKINKIKDGDCIILAGSIPKTLPDDIYERILKTLEGKDVIKVVDATKDLLMKVLPYKPFLIKPNQAELGELFNVEITTDDEIIKYARILQERGAKNVLVSLGKRGALLIPETGEPIKMGAPSGKAVNTVGSGDSMVAGFLAGYLQTKNYYEALALGSAAGSATAVLPGLADKKTIDIQREKINNGDFIC